MSLCNLHGMVFDLERFVRVARIEQMETCGPNDPAALAAMPAESSQYYPDGARACIHLEQAPTNKEKLPDGESYNPQGAIAATKNQHDFSNYLIVPKNGFRAKSVACTNRWIEPPFHESGKHKHLEAVVYAIEGEGYTEMNGKRIPWEAGTCSTYHQRCGRISTRTKIPIALFKFVLASTFASGLRRCGPKALPARVFMTIRGIRLRRDG